MTGTNIRTIGYEEMSVFLAIYCDNIKSKFLRIVPPTFLLIRQPFFFHRCSHTPLSMSNVEVAELSDMDDLMVEPKTRARHILGLEVDGSDLARSNVSGVLANQRRSATE